MIAPISRPLVTATAVALTLLAGCGGSPVSQAPGAPPPAASTSTAATPSASAPPTPSRKPSDETERVENASETFVDTAFTLSYADGVDDAYASRVKPLMTKRGYDQFATLLAPVPKEVRTRFGKDARSKPRILSGTKVRTLSADKATTTVEFTPRVQKLTDGRWKTVSAAKVDETAKLALVRDGDRWLVDRLE